MPKTPRRRPQSVKTSTRVKGPAYDAIMASGAGVHASPKIVYTRTVKHRARGWDQD